MRLLSDALSGLNDESGSMSAMPFTAPTTSPAPAPTPSVLPMTPPVGEAYGGAMPTSATPAPAMPTPQIPTPVMAPGIPSNPFGGVGGQTGDPLAFAPFTPSAPDAAQTASTVPVAGNPSVGDANYGGDTSGFPGGDLGAPTAGPASPFANFAAGGAAGGAEGGFTPTIASGLPPNQTAPLTNAQAIPYTPPEQRGPEVPTYQPPAYIPPDLSTSAGPTPPSVVPPEQNANAQGVNRPTDIAPTYAPVSVSNPTASQSTELPFAGQDAGATAMQTPFVPTIASGLPPDQAAPLTTPLAPSLTDPAFVNRVLQTLPADQQEAARAYLANPARGLAGITDIYHDTLRQLANVPAYQQQGGTGYQGPNMLAAFGYTPGQGTSSGYQAPAFIPPDLATTSPTPAPIQPLAQNPNAGPINAPEAPTLPPVSVLNPTLPTWAGGGENPPAPPTPTESPIAPPTVLPGTTTAAGPVAPSGPEGTPTPLASVPSAGLSVSPAAGQLAALTSTDTGTVAQGTTPPVSVNALLNPANMAPVGGGEAFPTPVVSGPTTPATVTQYPGATETPTTASPAAPTPLATAVPTAPVSVASAAQPSAIQATGLGGNAVTPFAASSVPTTGTAYAPALSTVTPENALTNQQIAVAPTADRFALAQQKFSDFVNQSNPAYQAALREATQRSAAAGGLGSGMLRTSYGNAELARENALNTARNQFLTEALQGTIGDAYQNAQIAAQQQGFQNQQQQQAFTNALMQQELANAMQAQGFNQAQQQLAAGSSGSPAELGMVLSQILGQQSTGSANAAAQIAQGIQAQQNAAMQQQMMLAYLNKMGIDVSGLGGNGQYGVSGTPTGAMPTNISDWLNTLGQGNAPATLTPAQQQMTINPQTGEAQYYDPSIDPSTGLPWGESLPFGGTY